MPAVSRPWRPRSGPSRSVIGDGLGLLRTSRVLLALVGVELFWGFAMVTFESLFPIRLAETLGSTDQAAAVMGPVSSVAWFVAAAGAAGVVLVSDRIGVARSAALLRIGQGATIVAMGLVAGPIGAVIAYLACYMAHGASNPMHTTLLHREVDGPHRTTVLSIELDGRAAGRRARRDHALSALADGTSISTAMIVGGIICALAAPLYIPAWRAERARRASGCRRVAASTAAAAAPARPPSGGPARYRSPMPDSLAALPLPEALVFDLDGTLIDTVETRIAAWLDALAEAGTPTTREQLAPLIGLDGKRLASEIAALAGKPIDDARAEAIDRDSGERYERLNRAPRPLPGVGELIDAIEARRIRWAIATSSRKDQVTASVASLGLRAEPMIVDASHVEAREARARPVAPRGGPARGRRGALLVHRRLDLGHGLGGRRRDDPDRGDGRLPRSTGARSRAPAPRSWSRACSTSRRRCGPA